MAQAVSRWPLTAWTRVRAQVSSCGIRGGQSGTGKVFIFFRFPPVSIIPPLLRTYVSPSHEMCNSPDLAAHYHTLCPELGASPLTRHVASVGTK
jgi:hypothetical protein